MIKRKYSFISGVSDSETVVFLGSYDRGKPRVRLLLEGARMVGLTVHECHVDIWSGIEDKSQLHSTGRRFQYIIKWIASRPILIFRYCRAPTHRSVVMPYPGVFDLLVLYPVIKWRGADILLDTFISPYDTVINDRDLAKSNSITAKTLYGIEWMAARAADVVFLDTESHSHYFKELFHLQKEKLEHVPVGVEISTFRRKPYFPWTGEAPLQVLFYGQFVPLQGTMILLEAISIWESKPRFSVQWTVIGKGQNSEEFDRKLAELKLSSVRRMDWIPYLELPEWIEKSDICCGIFGASQKALNVVPNKVYQALAVGRPILTADTPGVRSLLESAPAVELVQASDPLAIVNGLQNLGRRLLETPEAMKKSVAEMPIVGPMEVGKRLDNILQPLSRE